MKFLVRLEEIKRFTNSPNGNPRYKITYADQFGFYHTANTASDHAFAYDVNNTEIRAGDVVWVTFNGKGIIEDMEPNR